MNAKILLFTLSAAMVAMGTSCSKEDNGMDTNRDGEIRLCTAITQTRSIDQTLQNTQFGSGAKVGQFVTDNETSPTTLYNNRELTADGNGGLTVKSGENMYYGSNNKVNIYGYYPYNATVTLSDAQSFSVKADQSSDANSKASDLMLGAPTGTNPVKRISSAVSLTFAHKLSKVIVKLTPGAGSPELKGATVNVLNTKPTTTFTVKTKAITPATGVAATIKAATFAADATKFDCSAVVVPQSIGDGTRLIEVALADGGKLYYEAPEAGITFESGKSYTYNITVDLTELKVTTTITDWTIGTGDDDGKATMPDAE